MDLKTPLYDCHVAWGGKIVPFAGYLLPVQYETGVIKEHMAVRTACGLFDVSHMGEVVFQGKDAFANVQMLMCNDISNMYDGQVRYSPMCNEQGGVVDDVLVYQFSSTYYYVVVNAANRHKDVDWMKAHRFGDCTIEDISDEVAQLALQGLHAQAILSKLVPEQSIPKKYYSFLRDIDVQGIRCLVSRTGYTGEKGYELYCSNTDAPRLWELLLETGKEEGVIPCGLGARDTLRLEAAMPLYGHEMDDEITPLETGLGIFVKMGKDNFIGKAAMVAKGEPRIARVGLKVTTRGVVREHCDLFADGKQIGHTTSGTHCPYVNMPIAMALVDKAYAGVGTKMEAEVRGRRIEMEVVELPFYKAGK